MANALLTTNSLQSPQISKKRENPIQNMNNKNIKRNAKIRPLVTVITEEELSAKHTPNDTFATGGTVTKLKAADYVMKRGRQMFLCSGFDLDTATKFLMDGEQISGTLFRCDHA